MQNAKTLRVNQIKDFIAKNDQVSLKEVLGSYCYAGAFVTVCLEQPERNYFEEYAHLLSEEFYSNLFKCPEIFNDKGYLEDLFYDLPGVVVEDDNTVKYNGKEVMSMYLNPSKHAENYWKYLDGGENELTKEECRLLKENGSYTAIKYLENYAEILRVARED